MYSANYAFVLENGAARYGSKGSPRIEEVWEQVNYSLERENNDEAVVYARVVIFKNREEKLKTLELIGMESIKTYLNKL